MDEIIKNSEKEVDKLLQMYQQYMTIHNKLESLKTEKMKVAIEASKKLEKPLSAFLLENKNDPKLVELDNKKKELSKDMQTISNNMTFDNPIIWIMYKYKAYKGSRNEIVTMKQLKEHCEPKGYICTKRFDFLNSHLKKNHIDLTDEKIFPNEMKLNDLYCKDILKSLVNDKDFMEKWRLYEYHKNNGEVAKWENYITQNENP